MQTAFWQQRWQDNQIGFHLDDVNEYLIRHWSTLGIKPTANVLVPLCGKSVDMVWLASHKYHIIGVECSRKAIQAFYSEQKIQSSAKQEDAFMRYSGKNIDILEGDFFKLNTQNLSEIQAVYDRAALVALPEELRERYAQILIQHLPKHVSVLLVSIEYDQSEMSGPPFSVLEEEVHRLFSDAFNIELLEQRDMLAEQPRFRDRGVGYMYEKVYKLNR